jgi:acetyltransferase EpsM
MQDLICLGGGEHARVVIEAARSAAAEWHLLGFVDPSPCDETQTRLTISRLGADDCLSKYPQASLIVGMGVRGVEKNRQQLVSRLSAPSSRWAVVIHRAAWVSPTAQIGAGSVILAGAVINSGARIGSHCIVSSQAFIDHDAALGDFVHAGPGCIVGGGGAVGAESYLGMGSLIRDHCTIGVSCLVGMGAVVTKNFGDEARLIGMPARIYDGKS